MSEYTVIPDPTTGEPMLSVCTRGPLLPDDIVGLQALHLYRQKAPLTDAQQAWLDSQFAKETTP